MPDNSRIWGDLVKTALLGTDRMTPSVSTLETLKKWSIATENATEAALEGAGVAALLRKGARVLVQYAGSLPEPCAADEGQLCSAKSARHLRDILSGRYADALIEFAFHAQKNHKLIPPEYLPAMLHRTRGNYKLWAIIRPAVGKRGEWLLRQNPEWQQRLDVQSVEPDFEAPPQYKRAETLAKGRELAEYLVKNRIWIDEKRIFEQMHELAYHADVRLYEELEEMFPLDYMTLSKVRQYLSIILFRREMIDALQRP